MKRTQSAFTGLAQVGIWYLLYCGIRFVLQPFPIPPKRTFSNYAFGFHSFRFVNSRGVCMSFIVLIWFTGGCGFSAGSFYQNNMIVGLPIFVLGNENRDSTACHVIRTFALLSFPVRIVSLISLLSGEKLIPPVIFIYFLAFILKSAIWYVAQQGNFP